MSTEFADLYKQKKMRSFVEGCIHEWRDSKFDFLRALPTYHAYLAMMAMAQSESQLEKLHQSLPANARLLQNDWIKVTRFYRDCQLGDPEYSAKHIGAEARDQLLSWLLSELATSHNWTYQEEDDYTCPVSTACEYYVKHIKAKASKKPPAHFAGGENGDGKFTPSYNVVSCPGRVGFGDEHYYARLFGVRLKTGFWLSADKKHLLVRFLVKEAELTEELTYAIMSKLPGYYIWQYNVVSLDSEGEQLNISLEFEANGLADILKPADPSYDWLVAGEGFPSAASEVLRACGIPVEGVIPITPRSPKLHPGKIAVATKETSDDQAKRQAFIDQLQRLGIFDHNIPVEAILATTENLSDEKRNIRLVLQANWLKQTPRVGKGNGNAGSSRRLDLMVGLLSTVSLSCLANVVQDAQRFGPALTYTRLLESAFQFAEKKGDAYDFVKKIDRISWENVYTTLVDENWNPFQN